MKLKISRLFHWLYATLMFLPILMFIPSCLYYGFNEHAVNETTTEVTYKYESNEVNSLDDLIEGNIYHLSIDNQTLDEVITNNTDFTLNLLHVNSYDFSNFEINFDEYLLLANNSNGNVNIQFYFGNSFNLNIYVYLIDNNSDDALVSLSISELNSNSFSLDCVCQFVYYNGHINSSYFEYTDYNVIESVETNVQDTISNKMYLAWEGVWNLPLFQWTKNSFITAPFSYITGLFGLSSDNSLNCVFTYFASISICWLVFDLIMYVPNLAHRWLDRSAIE